ncbi:MAG: hypothetical protein GPJ52_06520 [Candidatus Heimdallarchaeota archaeon]|nr:hypothetical protein [Candidatus Heimdallarchaeota archaeon]
MKRKKNTKKFLFIFLMIMFLTTVFTVKDDLQGALPEPFFYVDILGPSYSAYRPLFPDYLIRELPKIGIGVDTVEQTGWGNIAPRIWGYPGPYPIPTYDEGGYDILFIGWGWWLDVDFTGLFDTPSWPPNGDNFYQYSRLEMDWAISNYSQSFTDTDRLYWANEIQQLLYEDLPAITLFYSVEVYPYDENFTGWDGLIWARAFQPMENWTIPDQTEFHYAVPHYFEDFHTMKTESFYDVQWLEQIYDSLIFRDSKTRGWTNRLAVNWSTSDGITYKVHLNPNAKWADGHSLNASDVEYSFDLFVDPLFGQPDYGHFCQYIDNESVSIISEFEVEISFLQNYVFQERNLALNIIPKHIWEPIAPEDQEVQALNWALNDTFDSQKFIGSGPYYLEDYNETNRIIKLKRNDYFDDWTGITPYFEYIYFEFYSNKESALLALTAGDLDMVDSNFGIRIEEVQYLPNVSYSIIDVPGSQEIALNQMHPYFGTGELCPIPGADSARHVRKAISHIVPRDEIIEEAIYGLGRPGVTPYPFAAFGFNASLEPYEFSVELAKQHMLLAGFTYSDEGTTFIFGANLPFIFGIIALIGGCKFLVRRFILSQEKLFWF